MDCMLIVLCCSYTYIKNNHGYFLWSFFMVTLVSQCLYLKGMAIFRNIQTVLGRHEFKGTRSEQHFPHRMAPLNRGQLEKGNMS